MAAWPKEDVAFEIVNSTTGSPDTTAHTVQLQPTNQTFPTGAVTCSQKSTITSMWGPDSDLDDETHYYVYVNSTKKDLIIARESQPMIGGGD